MIKNKLEKLNEAFRYLFSKGKINSQKEFANAIKFNEKNLSSAFNGSKRYLTDGLFEKLCNAYPEFNIDYFLRDEESMLKDTEKQGVKFYDLEFQQSNKKLIPLYDDVTTTFGGARGKVANVDERSNPSEYIDTGDWFTNATAAIRHYGESMIEYPEGSILALKEVNERQLIIWGRDYVIETNEYRITKRVQRGKTEDYIRAYSSNTETYPDGQLIHEPLDISWCDIRTISLVLGYVVKKNGGTMVYTNKNK